MSILLADIQPATSPAVAIPAGAQADASLIILWVCIGWAIAGLLVAYLLGAFKKQSIVGPERLAPTESAWDLLAVFIMVYFGGVLIASMVIGAMHPLAEAKLMLLQAGIDLLSFLAVILLLWRIRPGSVRLLGLDPSRISGGVAAGAATVFVMYPLIQITSDCVEWVRNCFHLTQVKPHELLQLIGQTQDRRMVVFAVLLACVIAPLFEELFFRGLLQTIFVRFFTWVWRPNAASVVGNQMAGIQSTLPLEYESALMPISSPTAGVRWVAVICSSAIFAAIHVEPAFLAPLFVLALGLGYVYERTGNLWVTITAHALFNTAQILLYMSAGR